MDSWQPEGQFLGFGDSSRVDLGLILGSPFPELGHESYLISGSVAIARGGFFSLVVSLRLSWAE